MPNILEIIPPRVPLTDVRTGLISREWYRFFFELFTKVGPTTASIEDLQLGPNTTDVAGAILEAAQQAQLLSLTQAQVDELARPVCQRCRGLEQKAADGGAQFLGVCNRGG